MDSLARAQIVRLCEACLTLDGVSTPLKGLQRRFCSDNCKKRQPLAKRKRKVWRWNKPESEEKLEPLTEPIPRRILVELWVAIIVIVQETAEECPTDPYSRECPRADSLLWLESDLADLVFHFLKMDRRREELMRELRCRHYLRAKRRYSGIYLPLK